MLHFLPDFSHSLCYPQSNWASLVLLPSGWACARSRPLWVSPMNSPVRLGVSPTAASTPMGVFNQWFEALFPCTGDLGCIVCFTSLPWPFLPVYLCVNVGPRGLLVVALLTPFVPQSAKSLGHRESCLPRLPVSVPPTGLDECLFFISLVVGLPCGSIFCQFWLFFCF